MTNPPNLHENWEIVPLNTQDRYALVAAIRDYLTAAVKHCQTQPLPPEISKTHLKETAQEHLSLITSLALTDQGFLCLTTAFQAGAHYYSQTQNNPPQPPPQPKPTEENPP